MSLTRRNLIRAAVAAPSGVGLASSERPRSDQGLESRLRSEIVDGELVIRIGISTLAFAAEEMPSNNPYDEDARDFVRQFLVTEPNLFARDVESAMHVEEENGDTPLNLFLDKMIEAAVEDGSMGVGMVKE